MVNRMGRFRYEAVIDIILVLSSFVAGVVNNLFYAIPTLVGLAVISVLVSYKQYREAKIQGESSSLTAVLEENILPQLKEDYYNIHPDGPEVRINVMIARRRNLNILNQDRGDVRFWEKTLMIEGSLGNYEDTGEVDLEWKTNEGVVGRAMNKRAQEIWADLNFDHTGRLIAGWKIPETHSERTEQIKSLLCVPIYLQSDSEKVEPVGVLSVDCEKELDVAQFDREDVRETVIKYANLIGAIIE